MKGEMRIISIRENPTYKDKAILYLQQSWQEINPIIYEDCISHSITAKQALPQWYLLEKKGVIVGCAGLITNDFISRMDLYPWFCALFIEVEHRGNDYGALLLEKAKKDSKEAGFEWLNLCTDHIGYYERYGFNYIGQGYHPWDEVSRIYQIAL
ncbi:GNAT family N-acetyltransferase [Pedobacter sp. PACM 27299]|uniref:GNAT family N-acetyltransferase n=1 Tax=Pedobacter sp. PACM 27299 TaxID=1727164 RepID=UPI000B1586FF|nr:GNAT family N-acetyltransferase [Pedobacter sp. PACM 27299]